MAWTSISTDNLRDKMSEAEYAAVSTASLRDGRTGPQIVAEEIVNTVNEVVGYCPGERGEEGTLPGELKDAALVILRHKVFTRIPGLKKFLDEGRMEEYKLANEKMLHASKGLLRITPPTTPAPATEQASGDRLTTISANTRRNTRDKLNGLY